MRKKDIIEAITSRDTHQVWQAACRIISYSQEASAILPLVEYLPTIKTATKGLDMGGAFAPNQRFVDFAIRVIEFHRDEKGCPCVLYLEHGVNPNKEADKSHVTITDTVRIEGKWVDYYKLACCQCSARYKVIERESHYMWWEWSRLEMTQKNTCN